MQEDRQMPVAEVNGIELYYEEQGEGPGLVFLHGAAGNHIIWWQQLPAFRDRFRCVSIDHRGFGRSTDPEGESAARFVDDLEALLDALGIERTALVSQSMGGRTALGFAVRHPQRVSAVVLADTSASIDWPEFNEELERQRAAIGLAEG
ncbi:MAG: alpha/beta hydrolase, partial [Chloroflexi bacterium]|nr:alpha/beta hydrolase [Chloroflexota bacterium]